VIPAATTFEIPPAEKTGFIASSMIYAVLPHSEIKGGVFKRKSNLHSLTIVNDPDIGLPFGRLPRLIIAYLCTEAVITGERRINLGRSQAEFARKLGITSCGGARGDITRLKDQCKRLFTSHIVLTRDDSVGFEWDGVKLATKGKLFWDPHNPDVTCLWNSWIDLSEELFNECTGEHAVPIKMDVIHRLQSTLAIDIYIWLTYRYNVIKTRTPISWKQLKLQFGANYKTLASFKFNFIKQLKSVKELYPEANFSDEHGTLILLPSKTSVPRRQPNSCLNRC